MSKTNKLPVDYIRKGPRSYISDYSFNWKEPEVDTDEFKNSLNIDPRYWLELITKVDYDDVD